MKIKTLYCLLFVFCVSLFAFAKDNAEAGKGNEMCQQQSKQLPGVNKSPSAHDVTDLSPIANIFSWEI